MNTETQSAQKRFLELSRVILDRLEQPRLQGWWNDLLGLTDQWEDCRRALSLPHWLSAWNAEHDAIHQSEDYDAAFDVRLLLDRWWKPGKSCNPNCFQISMQGENGTADSIKFAFGDPYRSLEMWGNSYAGRCDTFAGCDGFCVVTCSLHAAEDEVEDGKPALDDIRRDAIFIIRQWIRYAESLAASGQHLSVDELPKDQTPVKTRKVKLSRPGDPQEIQFAPSPITPEQFNEVLENWPSELPVPKNVKDVNFILWHKGQNPSYAPTIGEKFLSSMLHTAESRAVKSEPKETEEQPNEWKAARERNPEVTVENQMFTMFTNDQFCVLRTSDEIAKILGCGPSAVRKKGNRAWQMFRQEEQKIRQMNMEKLRRGDVSDDESEG